MATTPSRCKACETSILFIRPCAYGLRTKAAWSMFGKSTSSTYNPCPVSKRGSSLRLIRSPKYRVVIKAPNTNHYRWSSVPHGLRGIAQPAKCSCPCYCSTKGRFAAFELPWEDAEGNALVVQLLPANIAAEVFHVDAVVREQGIMC